MRYGQIWNSWTMRVKISPILISEAKVMEFCAETGLRGRLTGKKQRSAPLHLYKHSPWLKGRSPFQIVSLQSDPSLLGSDFKVFKMSLSDYTGAITADEWQEYQNLKAVSRRDAFDQSR